MEAADLATEDSVPDMVAVPVAPDTADGEVMPLDAALAVEAVATACHTEDATEDLVTDADPDLAVLDTEDAVLDLEDVDIQEGVDTEEVVAVATLRTVTDATESNQLFQPSDSQI